jgi:hypothetical protein
MGKLITILLTILLITLIIHTTLEIRSSVKFYKKINLEHDELIRKIKGEK